MHEIKTNINCTWQDSLTHEIMKIGQPLQRHHQGGETSSGYGSRESLAEGLLATKHDVDQQQQQQPDDAVITKQLTNINLNTTNNNNNNNNNNINTINNNSNNIDNISNTTCSCKRSGGGTAGGSAMSSRHSGCGSSRHSASSSRHSAGSRKNSSSKLSSVSHTTQQLVLHDSERHHISSTRKHSRNKHHDSAAETSSQRLNRGGDATEVNVENVSYYIDGLVQQNMTLAQELKTSRKFFEGTFSEMSAELSSAQMKIKILEETVNTYQENQKKLTSEGRSSLRRKRAGIKTHTVGTQTTDSDTHSPRSPTTTVPVVGVRKNRSSSADQPKPKTETTKTTTATNFTGPIIKDSPVHDTKRFKKLLMSGKFSPKGRELLAEKNQQLKTDIERLKSTMRTPPVAVIEPRDAQMTSSQHEESTNGDGDDSNHQQQNDNDATQEEERGERRGSRDTTQVQSPRNLSSSKRQQYKEHRKHKKEIAQENSEQDIGTAHVQSSLISHRDGSMMLNVHKERLSAEYRESTTTDSPVQSPRRRSSSKTRMSLLSTRNSRDLAREETISSGEV